MRRRSPWIKNPNNDGHFHGRRHGDDGSFSRCAGEISRCDYRTVERSVFEEVFGQEEDVGWSLGEAAHEVGVPLCAEGDVDADAETFGDEGALEVAADAVEHLELEGGFVEAGGGDEVSHVVDDGVVVGGYAAEDSAGDELAHELNVVGVDVGLGGECQVGGLFVSALAETDADALG